MAARDPVIVGVGLSDAPKAPHLDSIGHHVQAIQRALADCGLEKRAIDGYLCAGMDVGHAEVVSMAEYLGIDHRYIDGTMTGGSSFEFHVQHAAAAIRDGCCDTVLVSYGSDFLSRRGRTLGTGGFRGPSSAVSGADLYSAPYGLPIVGGYAMVALFKDELPYVVAMIELDEGVRIMGNLTSCPVESVRIGMPVEAYAVECEGGMAVPFWRPAAVP